MQLEDLKVEYDKLQIKYGAKELTSVYNGGCINNPDICFVFMNPTGRNIAGKEYKVYPVYYPIGNGMMNIEKAIEDMKFIVKQIEFI